MNLLIDRREKPSEEVPSLPADRRRGSLYSTSHNGSSSSLRENSKPRTQKRMSLPTISVNDKPVLARQATLSQYNSPAAEKRATSYNWSRQLRHEAAPDLTSAATGMFSECMFESPPRKPSGSSASSTCSAYARLDWIECEHLRRNSSSQSSSHRHRHHYTQTAHRRGSTPSHYHEKRYPARSYSSTVAPDRKRLVNQFLRSAEPSTSNISTPTKESVIDFPNVSNMEADQRNSCFDPGRKGSLQALLYRDLEQLPRTMTKPPPITVPGQPTSSPPSNTSSYSVFPEEASISSSSSFDISDESYLSPEFGLDDEVYEENDGMFLNYNEVDYVRRHIANQLHNFENILKQNLREVLIKDEYQFKRNLKNFDLVSSDLNKLKQQVVQMYESIKHKSLASLRREFEENEKDTFISKTNAIVAENLRELESLEERIELSKEKLVRQRETLKKMESLLSLKDDMLASQKNTKLAYQYRYMVFDFGAFILLVAICIFIKWLL